MTVIQMRSRIIENGNGHDFDRLVPLPEVRRILGMGFRRITELIRDGVLTAHNVSGRLVHLEDVSEDTRGLRIPESVLREYIEHIRIK
jgi:hypothetical protein